MFLLLGLVACSDPPPARAPAPPHRPPPPMGHPGPVTPPPGADAVTFTVTGKGGPSIVWITTDTVSAGHLAPWGGRVPVPNLERLGAVRVEEAFSNFPETALSHWSLFTGVLPEVHGNVPPNGMSRYSGPSAAELAHARGYATAAFIGGITLVDEGCGLSRGFDVYDDDLPPGADHRPAAEVVRLAEAWMQKQTGPYYVWLHLFDAHLPYTPADPTRFDKDYAGTLMGTDAALAPYRESKGAPPARDLQHVEALYDAEIAEVDAALGPLVDALKGDEIVVVNADHGESFAHDYLFNHRAVLWDDVLHVPLYVKAPGLPPAAVKGMVGLVDVLPTVVELAGWTVTAPFMGSSRVGVLRGQGGGATRHWARTDPWLPAAPGEPGARFAERTPTTKLIRELDATACRYDLVTDAAEAAGVCDADADAAWKDYQAAVASMAAYQRPDGPRSGPRTTPGEMLEQLGYVDKRVDPPK